MLLHPDHLQPGVCRQFEMLGKASPRYKLVVTVHEAYRHEGQCLSSYQAQSAGSLAALKIGIITFVN